VFGLGRLAERATTGEEQRPVGVLLLPQRLEAFALRERAEDLLTAPGVFAVDPARISYRALGRLPDTVVTGIVVGQARRLRFGGVPRAVVIFHPLQYPLARALISEHPDAQLWYGDGLQATDDESLPSRVRERVADLDTMAAMRADWRFDATPADGGPSARERNRELWERMEALGIESGRLGSERADVMGAWRDGGASPS
jgi:hypothetical protein